MDRVVKIVRADVPDPSRVLNNEALGGTAPDPCNTPAARGGRDATPHKSLRRLRHRIAKTRPGHLGATKFIVTVVGPVGFEPTTSVLDSLMGDTSSSPVLNQPVVRTGPVVKTGLVGLELHMKKSYFKTRINP